MEWQVGQKVKHEKYGRGKVVLIDADVEDYPICVKFYNSRNYWWFAQESNGLIPRG